MCARLASIDERECFETTLATCSFFRGGDLIHGYTAPAQRERERWRGREMEEKLGTETEVEKKEEGWRSRPRWKKVTERDPLKCHESVWEEDGTLRLGQILDEATVLLGLSIQKYNCATHRRRFQFFSFFFILFFFIV